MKFTRREFVAGALLAPARAGAQDAPYRVLEAREGELRLLPEPAKATKILGFDGEVPGPLLRLKPGEELRARLVNRLARPTAIHWHGVRVVNAMDGAAGLTQEPVAPGASFDYRFTPPDSGLFWYRASALPDAAEQKGRGLYGVLIVEEAEPPSVDREVLLVLDDWRLDGKGAISGDFLADADVRGEGRIGSTVTVNSKTPPETIGLAPGARLRLRLLNACNARVAGIIFENVAPLVVGVDGQACEAFAPIHDTIPVGPGARFDVMFDLPREAGAQARVLLRGGGLRADKGGEDDRALMVLRAEGDAIPERGPIRGPALNPKLPAEVKLQNAKRLDLLIAASASKNPREAWTINGVAGSPRSKPLFAVPRGQPVSLGFVNKCEIAQSLHVHGHHMRVLHPLDDGWEPYWRDSVILPPGRTVRVAFVADNPGKWLIESAIPEHAASGAMAWFEVR